jgi:MraZ protein
VKTVLDRTPQASRSARFMNYFEHTLDDRGRVSLPAKYRDALNDVVVVTRGPRNFLVCYPWPEWERVLASLDNFSVTNRQQLRALQLICGTSSREEIDKQGRVLIPANLRRYAGIKDEVVIEGLNTRFAIWDKAAWQANQIVLDSENDRIVQDLDEHGVIL